MQQKIDAAIEYAKRNGQTPTQHVFNRATNMLTVFWTRKDGTIGEDTTYIR